MRAGIVVNVTREDRRRLEGIVADRSALQKYAWRANIILATADGCGTTHVRGAAAARRSPDVLLAPSEPPPFSSLSAGTNEYDT